MIGLPACAVVLLSEMVSVSSRTFVNSDNDGNAGGEFEESRGVDGTTGIAEFTRGPEGSEAVLLWP